MPRDIVATRQTRFDPKIHGFRFTNTQILWRWMAFSGRYLCGGMAFASLDHFKHGVPIPQDPTPPPPRTPLNDYLTTRQVDAHRFAGPALVGRATVPAEHAFRRGLRTEDDFGTVVRRIDVGEPIPILLVGVNRAFSPDETHWVVAIGYEMDEAAPDYGGRHCGRLLLYDSNQPGVTTSLWPDFRQQCFQTLPGHTRYRSYCPHEGFRTHNPRHGQPGTQWSQVRI
jgi:hypothetical protein